MKPMHPGLLRQVITINQPVPGVPDVFGASVNAWKKFGTFRAFIAPVSGREIEVAKTYASTVSHRVEMRYAPGILPTFQLVFGVRSFNINAVLNDEERNIRLILYCSEQIQT